MSEYLKTALKAIHAAEDVVMKYYDSEKGISHKGPVDLVTKADVEAEKLILKIEC